MATIEINGREIPFTFVAITTTVDANANADGWRRPVEVTVGCCEFEVQLTSEGFALMCEQYRNLYPAGYHP